ncbi:MAG: hypothetical protein ACT4ON_09080 [Bacteroidota bacterium]
MKNSFRLALVLTIAIACSFTRSMAQDTLIMTNGNIVPAKILEVSTEEVRYKRLDNLEGPVFITKTTEINKIKYQSGNTDIMNKPKAPVVTAPVDPNPPIERSGAFYRQGYQPRMKEREMQTLLLKYNDTQMNYHVKKARVARGMQNIGFVAIPALAFTIGYSIYAVINNNNNRVYNSSGPRPSTIDYTPGIITGVLAAAAVATSITFGSLRRNHNKAAVKIFNEKY